MLKKRRISIEANLAEVNLTPMIDVTFQLLIFFMVTSQMAKLDQVAGLHLPKADAAAPDDRPPKDRLTINILPDKEDGSGVRYIVGGDEKSLKKLRLLVYREAERSRGQEGYSTRPVLIRADRNLNYKHVQTVMNLLLENQVWKISFGAAEKTE